MLTIDGSYGAGGGQILPLAYLILLGDGLHNLIGGLAVAGTFPIDVRLGITQATAVAGDRGRDRF